MKRQRAAVASQIDTLQATDAQLDAALAALQANVTATQAAMNDADAEVQAAPGPGRPGRARRRRRPRPHRRRSGVRSCRPQSRPTCDPQADQTLDMFREDSANDASTKQALIDATSGAKLDVVDEYKLGAAAPGGPQGRGRGRPGRGRRRGRDALADKKAGFDAALHPTASGLQPGRGPDQRQAGRVPGAGALDSKLSSQLAAEQAALAARVKAAPQQRSAAVAVAVAVAAVGPVINRPGLSTVGGITVASSIAGQLASLLNAASAAGYNLGGSGYRDSSGQVALRRQNCGTSDYAIYQMPPEQCSPPTAIPGRSKHEQGLAIDFTIGGEHAAHVRRCLPVDGRPTPAASAS